MTPCKPTAGFWITVALVVVLGYPLSMGPAVWVARTGALPGWLQAALSFLYWPINQLIIHGPEPLSKAIGWYVGLWM